MVTTMEFFEFLKQAVTLLNKNKHTKLKVESTHTDRSGSHWKVFYTAPDREDQMFWDFKPDIDKDVILGVDSEANITKINGGLPTREQRILLRIAYWLWINYRHSN